MQKSVFITGANGEIGRELINKLGKESRYKIVALDIADLDKKIAGKVYKFINGDILESDLIAKLFTKYKFDITFHLAALLSTSSEKDPLKAHRVNVDGAINIISIAEKLSRENKKHTQLIFPSSIAVYGLSGKAAKKAAGKVKEEDYNLPTTMYGSGKLYIELVGNYYAKHYEKTNGGYFDFRALRFPGIISAGTLPTGGTSDFGPEMLHSAARKKNYECFVRADTKIPFMAMPDAAQALKQLAFSPKKKIKQHVYNVASFSLSAKTIEEYAQRLHSINVDYVPNERRQAIVDSWPEDIDDSKARADWGWQPSFGEKETFEEYFIPLIKQGS